MAVCFSFQALGTLLARQRDDQLLAACWSTRTPTYNCTPQCYFSCELLLFIYLYILYACISVLNIWSSQMALVVKNLPASAEGIRDIGLILGLGRFPGEGIGYPLQYFCLENLMDRGALLAMLHRVAKSQA